MTHYKIDNFKEKIKDILIKNRLIVIKPNTGYYNNNISRKSFWDNNFPEYSNRLFDLYRRECEKYENLKVVDFIKIYFFNKNFKKLGLFRKFNDIFNFLDKCDRSDLRSKHYQLEFLSKFNDIVNFKTKNIYEVKYCYDHGLKDRPRCPVCNQSLEFVSLSSGYHKFCSLKCQMSNNNSLKTPKLSSLSDDEIREYLKTIPKDRRNLTNQKYADVYNNIYNYSSNDKDLKNAERLFLFMNKLPVSYTICPYCKIRKKIFKSSEVGYSKTCGYVNCIKLHRYPNTKPASYTDARIGSNRSEKLKDCFLYVLRSNQNNFYKIGISLDPILRLRNLKNVIDDFEIVFCVFLKNANTIEKELHNKFRNKKSIITETFDGYSECFDLNDNDIRYIKDYLYENQ